MGCKVLPLGLLLVVVFALQVLAAPAFVVEKVVHDFGLVTQGEKLTYTYRFHNAGDQVLEIDGLRSSCGCTAALLSTNRLEPGAMGELRITFDSSGFRGQVQKVISFETSDPAHPAVSFVLNGEVKAELYVNPQRVNWGRVSPGTALRQQIEVVNDTRQKVGLRSVQASNDRFRVDASSMSVEPGQSVTVTVSAQFPDDKKRLAGYVIIHSDFPPVPELKVPVSARLSKN